MTETLRVSAHSKPNAVAGAIAGILRTQRQVEVQAIGPAAVNQAMKAVAIARGYILPDGLDLTVQPAFVKLEMPLASTSQERGEERTAMKFAVFAYVLPT